MMILDSGLFYWATLYIKWSGRCSYSHQLTLVTWNICSWWTVYRIFT